MYFVVCFVVFLCVSVSTEVRSHDFCRHKKDIGRLNCRIPGMNIKHCLCSCVNPTITRDYLQTNIDPCATLLKHCSYRMWIDLQIMSINEDDPTFFRIKNLTINNHESTKVFPLPQLKKLATDMRYKVYIITRSTVTISGCTHKLKEIPPIIPKITNQTTQQGNSLYIIIAAGIPSVLFVISTCLYLKHRKRSRNLENASDLLSAQERKENEFSCIT